MNSNILYKSEALLASRFIIIVGAVICAIIAMFAILGWVFDVSIWRSFLAASGSLKVNNSICFLLTSTYLISVFYNKFEKYRDVFLFFSFTIAFLTLLQHFYGFDFGIDELFFTYPELNSNTPGRMSIASCINHILLVASIKFRKKQTLITDLILMYCILLPLFVFITHFYNFEFLANTNFFGGMAMNTAIALLVVSFASMNLFLEKSLFGIMLRDDLGGSLARLLFLFTFLYPLGIIFLDLFTYNKQNAGDMTISYNIIYSIIVLTVMILYASYRLSKNDIERRIQLNLVKTQKSELQVLNNELLKEFQQRKITEGLLENELQRVIKFEEFRKKIIEIISHQFRTPLTKVFSAMSIVDAFVIKQNIDEDKIISKSIKTAENGIAELNYLLKSTESLIFLNSSMEESQVSAFYLEELETSLRERFQFDFPDRIINFEYEQKNKLIVSRQSVFTLILYHLIDNALKYSKEDVNVQFSSSQYEIVIVVSDKGKGIREEDMPYIYDMLFRGPDEVSMGKYHGLGVGLPTAKYCTEFLSGHIICESQVNEFTTFTIIIPNLINEYTAQRELD